VHAVISTHPHAYSWHSFLTKLTDNITLPFMQMTPAWCPRKKQPSVPGDHFTTHNLGRSIQNRRLMAYAQNSRNVIIILQVVNNVVKTKWYNVFTVRRSLSAWTLPGPLIFIGMLAVSHILKPVYDVIRIARYVVQNLFLLHKQFCSALKWATIYKLVIWDEMTCFVNGNIVQ